MIVEKVGSRQDTTRAAPGLRREHHAQSTTAALDIAARWL
jgi:hypothetical protein